MRFRSIDTLLAIAFLAAVCVFGLYHLGLSVYRIWFFSSDEYVVAGEVIRFVQLDFRQHFFDMPGTPYITFCAILWGFRFGWAGITGTAGGLPIAEFTFDHLPELFYLMRGVTLFFYFMSLVLTYFLARRLTNSGGAMAATLLLALSVPYASYSSFVRVESMAVSLFLGALLLTYHFLDKAPAGWADQRGARTWMIRFAAAGVLFGWTGATRLHSLTLTVPLLILLFALRERAGEATKSDWIHRLWFGLALLFGLSTAVSLAAPWIAPVQVRETLAGIPAAVRLARLASLASVVAAALVWACYRSVRWNRVATKWAGPEISCVAVGFLVGLGTGMFPLVTQSHHLGHSVQMYSTIYIDRARALLPLADNIRQYASFYKQQFTPDHITALLVAAGMVWIAVERRRALIPFLVSALLFFVSKPLNLVAASHHVILWLPSWYLCAAYPVARLWNSRRFVGPLLGCLVLALIARSAPNGPATAGAHLPSAYESRRNIERATEWMDARTQPGDLVAISYYCFNKHVFFEWMKQLEVPVPPSRQPGGKVVIWWGHRRTVLGQQGFACAAPGDAEGAKERLDLEEPGSGTNPYRDPAFRREVTFGSGATQIDVFRFDLRK